VTQQRDAAARAARRIGERCPVEIGFPTQSMTISALEYLARKGVLYFNLHTKANTFYGEVRGQIDPASADAN
jgi:hypothetical protein